MRKIIFSAVFFLSLLFSREISANVGVGVGTGKIIVDEPLHSGVVYQLPTLTVINTGDQTSVYGVGISHREKQKELVADESWFSFEPSSFQLDPGKTQNVEITLTLPLRTVPGDYFVFVEAHPEVTADGGVQIGIAAASKLYFKVVPENFFYAIYYRLISLWQYYMPWSKYLAIAVAFSIVVIYLLKNFDLRIHKKTKEKK